MNKYTSGPMSETIAFRSSTFLRGFPSQSQKRWQPPAVSPMPCAPWLLHWVRWLSSDRAPRR
jgi:hypothetical protein